MELLAAICILQWSSACSITVSGLHRARRRCVFLGPCKYHTYLMSGLTAALQPATQKLEAWHVPNYIILLPAICCAVLFSTHMAVLLGFSCNLKQSLPGYTLPTEPPLAGGQTTLTWQAMSPKAWQICTCPRMAARRTWRMPSIMCAHMPALNIREPQSCQVCLRPLSKRLPDAQCQLLQAFRSISMFGAGPGTSPWEHQLRHLNAHV